MNNKKIIEKGDIGEIIKISELDLTKRNVFTQIPNQSGYYKFWVSEDTLNNLINAIRTRILNESFKQSICSNHIENLKLVEDYLTIDKIKMDMEYDESTGIKLYCIYVGSTANLRRRLNYHIRRKEYSTSTLRQTIGSIFENGHLDNKNCENTQEFMENLYFQFFCSDICKLKEFEIEEINKTLHILNLEDNLYKSENNVAFKLRLCIEKLRDIAGIGN